MAMVKCKGCKANVSTYQKVCPDCGSTIKPPSTIPAIIVAVALGYFLFTLPDGTPLPTATPAPTPASTEIAESDVAPPDQEKKDALTAYFKSDEEPSVIDAVWTSDTMFKVGMYDLDGSKDGFAMYVCLVMKDYGFGAGYSAQVVDIVKLVRDSDWVTLGEAQCN